MLDTTTTAENPRAVVGGNNPPLTEQLPLYFEAELREVEAIAAKADALPKRVDSDEALLRFGDLSKAAMRLSKKLDALRADEKEPHLTAGRTIDAFFNVHRDRLARIAAQINERATDYQREKAAAERRKAEEIARKAREAEDAARQKAQEAHEAQRHASVAKHEDKAEDAAEKARRAEAQAQASAADLTRIRSTSGTVATTRTTWDFEITDLSAVPLEKLRPYLPRADIEKAIRAHVRINKNGAPLDGVRIFENATASFR